MGLTERIALIRKIEELRGSTVICYLTGLRPNVTSVIADDSVRVFFDHLLLLPSRPIPKFDLFLCSNGGAGTVPWRLVSLFREFATSFNVLIPYRAYSAATLIALGADEIVMHPFGEMGPIDPTVSNEFNPTDNSGRRLGISVEDVKAYIDFVKTTVGIHHEDELIKALEALTAKVHPLALGTVERFLSQTRMVARKILRTHMLKDEDEHTINEIIEVMASKLYFHGHPINRKEAKEELDLEVNLDLQPGLESAMWDLYKEYDKEFDNQAVFSPQGDLAALPPAPQAQPGQPPTPKQCEYHLVHAMIESARLSSKHTSHRRFTLFSLGTPGQQAIQEDILTQGWIHSSVPTPVPESPQNSSSPEDAQGDADRGQDKKE